MKVALLSTYPPRPCGIGTFSADLRRALLAADPGVGVDVLSIVHDPAQPSAPEVFTTIRQNVQADYLTIGALLDERGTDVLLIEHEYGIFGGEAGSHLLPLVRAIEVPYVVTLHTVLSTPSAEQRSVLTELCARAVLVTVFTETASRMIIESGVASADRVRVVPHGAPQALVGARGGTESERRSRISGPGVGRTVLSTFGLISAGKGIETAIRCLPTVVERHPDVLYLIAGQTHPEVVRAEGERYRLELERLVRDLGLSRSVRFLDRFLGDEDLGQLLGGTDVYLTPYRSKEQIVSGALTFAVAAGCPVVSTPYFYAEDLLSGGAGILVPFDDPAAMAEAVLQYLDDPIALAEAGRRSREIGANLAWPAVGASTLAVLEEAVQLAAGSVPADHEGWIASSPPFRTDHLLTLTDDVGIIQHADGTVPRYGTGYTVDDVARLVIVALELGRGSDQTLFARVVARGLGFLCHAWVPGVGMHNEMSFSRTWLDEPFVGDHVGRTISALGAVLAAQPPRVVARPSLDLLGRLSEVVASTDSPRTIAFAILGLTRPPPHLVPEQARRLLPELASRLADLYRSAARPDWPWFEDGLYYDNAKLPEALIAAGRRLDDPVMLQLGLDSLEWLGQQCNLDGPYLQLVGNTWRRRSGPADTSHPGADTSDTGDDTSGRGDEQALDAAALVECLVEAYRTTGRRRYADQAVRAFEWFLGRNRLGEPMYDFATGGTHDGLSAAGRNDNEGAESTLAFFQALLALEDAGLQSSLPTTPAGMFQR